MHIVIRGRAISCAFNTNGESDRKMYAWSRRLNSGIASGSGLDIGQKNNVWNLAPAAAAARSWRLSVADLHSALCTVDMLYNNR